MTTIKQHLNLNFMQSKTDRLAKLEELSAPQILIDTLKKEIDSGDATTKVGKIKEYGSLEFVSREVVEYRRGNGITFTLENGQKIKGIPGPHSFFLTL